MSHGTRFYLSALLLNFLGVCEDKGMWLVANLAKSQNHVATFPHRSKFFSAFE